MSDVKNDNGWVRYSEYVQLREERDRLRALLEDAHDDAIELANVAVNEHRADRADWYRTRAKAIAAAIAPK